MCAHLFRPTCNDYDQITQNNRSVRWNGKTRRLSIDFKGFWHWRIVGRIRQMIADFKIKFTPQYRQKVADHQSIDDRHIVGWWYFIKESSTDNRRMSAVIGTVGPFLSPFISVTRHTLKLVRGRPREVGLFKNLHISQILRLLIWILEYI